MLEILYDTATLEVRAWNADMKVAGNLIPKEKQEVITFDIDPPSFESDIYYIDLANKRIKVNPNYTPVIPRNPLAEIDDLKAKLKQAGIILGIPIIRKS